MKNESTIQELDSTISISEVDLALHFLRNGDQVEGPLSSLTEVEEDQLLRKIDWMLMPLMAATYNLQYLDKTIRNLPHFLPVSTLLVSNVLRHRLISIC